MIDTRGDTQAFAPVSVLIPCFNCASCLERAVSSVAAQTLRPAELILVDDGSTDSTRQIIKKLCAQYGNDWLRLIALEKNSGPATARNAGWDAARQPYVAFLDADDSWDSGKLQAQLTYMQARPELALTAHSCKLIRPGEAGIADTTVRGTSRLSFRSLLLKNRIATRTVMLKRENPYRFSPGKRYAEDYLLWLQMASDGHRLELLDAQWAFVFKSAFGEAGLSAQLWEMEKGELAVYRQLAKEGRLARSIAFMCSVFSLLKYVRRLIIVRVKQH